MERVRVYELAKQFGLTNEQMISFLINNDIDVKNHMTVLETASISKIIKKLDVKKNLGEHKNRTSLKRIKIEGLFGKYNYKIDFKNDVCIWVSENGVGKTTILNILVAILNGDKKTLAETNFEKIEVTLGSKTYLIDKTKVKKQYTDNRHVEMLLGELRRFLPLVQYRRIIEAYKERGKLDLEEIETLLARAGYRDREIYGYDKRYNYILEELRDMQFNDFSNELYEIKSKIIEEPLFYPTYRRIEASWDKVFLNSTSRSNGELSEYICFGMEDVKKRIKNLLNKMSEDAHTSYVEMNGAIISDLLTGASMRELTRDIPNIDRHKVEVVIKRIGEERIENIDRLKEFVNENAENPNEEFLKFYLDKLVKIYDSQKAIDDKLSSFAKVCTKYLVGKKIVYDEAMLTLAIFNSDDEKLDFDDLSSGEKQVVSIFSKVYLDVTTTGILIIDEPEISLSIEWQKEFLVDIYNSGKVGLLIATTHSPFIFKNEFREYTMEIDMYKEG